MTTLGAKLVGRDLQGAITRQGRNNWPLSPSETVLKCRSFQAEFGHAQVITSGACIRLNINQ
jgi:hypothetical protein